MFRLVITNELNGDVGTFQQPTLQAAERQRDRLIATGRFGRPQRWVLSSTLTQAEVPRVLQTRTAVVNGDVVEESELPDDYSVVITDLSNDAAFLRRERLRLLRETVRVPKQDIEFGEQIVALLGKQNEDKGLTTAQINTLLTDPVIQGLVQILGLGGIERALELVSLIVPDGTLITQANIDEVSQLLNDYLIERGA